MFSGKCVTVITGGNSSERDVSLVSGQCVYQALAKLDIQTKLLRIADLNDLMSNLSKKPRSKLRGIEKQSVKDLIGVDQHAEA